MAKVLACMIVAAVLCVACGSAAQEVLAGFDLWETVWGFGETFYDFSAGSDLDLTLLCPEWAVIDPPHGLIELQGVGIGLGSHCCPGENLLATDTVVERLEDTVDLELGPDQVPIQICELHMHSVAPFTVRNAISLEVQVWELDVVLPTIPQPVGQMTITRIDANGGTFTADLPVSNRVWSSSASTFQQASRAMS